MRAPTARAAMRRGCVWPMTPATPRPASRQIFGSCVVLPEPVSPQTMTTGCCLDGAADLVAIRRDRQFFRIASCRHTGRARGACRHRRGDLLRERGLGRRHVIAAQPSPRAADRARAAGDAGRGAGRYRSKLSGRRDPADSWARAWPGRGNFSAASLPGRWAPVVAVVHGF